MQYKPARLIIDHETSVTAIKKYIEKIYPYSARKPEAFLVRGILLELIYHLDDAAELHFNSMANIKLR